MTIYDMIDKFAQEVRTYLDNESGSIPSDEVETGEAVYSALVGYTTYFDEGVAEI